MRGEEIELRAPAKLTLSLRVTGVRADGYHLLDAEMVTVDLADSIRLTPLDERAGPADAASSLDDVEAGAVALTITEARGGLPVAAGTDNTVHRALALGGRRAAVHLVKRIPAGAGLGGGSADAAAVLRWCGISDLAVAASLGADVPFCVLGGRARVRGIGEVVEPLPFEDRTFTLLIPPFGCSTPAVYAAWDRLATAGSRAHAAGTARNDLEAAALEVEPRLADWRDQLAAASGQRPRLAGSGSAWFVEGAFPGEGRIVVRTCR